jgi:hypothetical protein
VVIDARAKRATFLVALATAAVALLLLARAAGGYVDPDVFHLMALARATCALGHVPTDDLFAYTPTVHPTIQHEWGMGMILYGIVHAAGAPGLLALRYALTIALAVACAACARRRGASAPVLLLLAPIGVLLASASLSTVRAQMLTLVFTALLLLFLEQDRAGKRGWIALWLPLFLVWTNVHGGFVVGLLFLAVHIVEQALRRRPVRHLVLVLAACGLLLGATPYGFAHVPFLVRGILLRRPDVDEWAPIVRAAPLDVALFAGSLALALGTAWSTGLRRAEGLALLLLSAAATVLHQRHLGIYAVAWTCQAPGFVEASSLGPAIRKLWSRSAFATAAFACVLGIGAAASFVRNRPFALLVPSSPEDGAGWTYPVGAVAWLSDIGFRGNVLTPFHAGAYVSWKLHPDVRVSFDGRYEVAYPEGAERENVDFFLARPEWRAILAKYPTDVVLAAEKEPVARRISEAPGWKRAYADGVWSVWSRPGLDLPALERARIPDATFP